MTESKRDKAHASEIDYDDLPADIRAAIEKGRVGPPSKDNVRLIPICQRCLGTGRVKDEDDGPVPAWGRTIPCQRCSDEWNYGKPPSDQIVEVEYKGAVIRVRAIWGRDGTLPHWESEDRDTLWSVSAFYRWRAI
jgi:hypothetical protein